MDELQILIKAIVAENSEQGINSELLNLIKRLGDAHKISLKVGIDKASVKSVKSELQTIAKQVSSASGGAKSSGSRSTAGQINVFDSTQLKADGQRYFNYVRDIVSRAQKEFSKMGKVDITNVFKDAKGDIQSFTASVTKADGVVEKFNFELAKIKNGKRNLSGFVQTNSVLADRSAGSDLEKTLNFLNRIDTKISDITSKTLKNTSKPLLGDMEQYGQYQKKLNEVKTRIAEIKQANATLSGDHKREIASMVADLQRYAKELQKSAYAATDLNAATFSNKKSELQEALRTDIQKWQNAGIFGGDFEASVNKAKAVLDGALDPTDLEEYKHQLSLLNQQFKQFKLSNTASGKVLDADVLNTNIQTAQLRIQNLKRAYSSLVQDPELLAKWQNLFDSSQIVSSKDELKALNANIRKFEQELISAGKHSRSLFDELKANAVKMGTWMVLGGVIAGIMRGVTGLYDAVIDLDTAMTELKKVTNETDEAYDKFLSNAAKKSVEIGTTYADFINSSASFARLGYTIDDSAKLAEVANIYAVVGDEINGVDEATTSIISTMKAFGIEADNAMSIVDKFNKIGNNFAISSGGVGDAMQRSAAALASANNTIDQSIALIVAANNVIQDPDMVGTMWKTVSMRIRGAKTELEEAGLETEYMAESTASLQKQVKALTNIDGFGGFDIMLDSKTFKSTYDIILGISKVWKDMSDIDQAALLELLAGKRQGNALAAALTNMKDAEKVLRASSNAEGSAMEEHEKWMESVRAKQQKFQAQYEAFANSILNSNLIKGTYDAGTGILGWITQVTDAVGALPVLFSAVTPFMDKLTLFRTATGEDGQMGVHTFWGANKLNLENDKRLLDEYNTKIISLGDSTSDLTLKQIIWNDTIGKGTGRLKDSIKISDEATLSVDDYAIAVQKSGAATTAMGIKSKAAAIGVQVLNTALNMMISFGVGLAINAIVSGITSLINKANEAREAAIESAESAGTLSDEIVDLTNEYIDLSEAVKTDTSVKNDLLSTQDELIKKLGLEKEEIDELVKKYGNLTDAIKAASVEKLQEAERDLRAGVPANSDALLDKAKPHGVAKWSMNHIIASWDKDDTEANQNYLSKLVDAGYISSGSYGSLAMEAFLPSDGEFDLSTVEGIINSYERLGKMMDLASEEADSNSAVYRALADEYNRCKDAIGNYTDSIDALNSNLAQQQMLQSLIGREVPKTKEEFDAYRNSVIEAAKGSGEFIGSDEDIANAVDGILRSQTQFASFYADEFNTAGDAINDYKVQVTDLADTISKLQSAYNVLETAQKEMASGSGLSASTIQALADANENYLDYLYEENGVIKLNTDAWKENANSKMQGEMQDIEQEITDLQAQNAELQAQNAELERGIELKRQNNVPDEAIEETTDVIKANNDAIEANNARIRENQGLLSVYSTLYGSITGDISEYNNTLNNFANIATTIDSVASSYASLANLQRTVADGFTMSLDKILEYAKAYPQILDSATVTANGELALNEAVVNSFIEGKKAELNSQIDAQIAQLEADKAVFEAKKAFAQSQLEIAQQVGEGEGQISKEVAEYKINAGNAIAQAMIDAGIDEATAYKLAAAAMSQNVQEFQRIAYQVCKDTEGNFNAAAYNAAMAMYNNANSMQGNLAAVAAQAHQTAYAIAAMASGALAGTDAKVGGLSGGSSGGGISLNLTQGSFSGADYTYTPKQVSLDDYISQLNTDITDYTNAIAQIDGQIAALEALRNTPFDKFQNLVNNASDIVGGKNNSGSGGGSGGKSDAEDATKLVDEYKAAIDEYYEALKRLEAAQERRQSLERELEHTEDFSRKIFIAGDLVGAYKEESDAEKNLMAAKQATISANVSALQGLGFDVDYDSSKNKLFIKNLEHLNELTATTAGKYDTLQEATNALRQDTEDLIDTTEKLNSENISAAENIEDLGYQVLETKNDIVSYIEEIYKKQVDAYRDIIEQRKELIESAKEEYDYEADIADKVEEIADLQARIDQLSLDDSRSALAERRALEEELAKLQDDLSQTQSNHSTDAQIEALDKLADDYEKTADEDIAILQDTVSATEDVWNTFYDMILGKNVTIGDSINAEIADAWLRAAQAVQSYGTVVNDLPGVSTVVGTLPKYHTGGVVSDSNLGNKETLAVLKEGEVVLTKEMFDNYLKKNSGFGVIGHVVNGLTHSEPAISKIVKSIVTNNNSTDNSVLEVSPHIEVHISHSGSMSDNDMKKYGKKLANITIGEVMEVFRQNGIINNRGSRLRPG